MDARSSGEVLEAKRLAEMALHLAKVMDAAAETQADCLRIITRAEMRMADEIDGGQERGEVARPRDTLRQNIVVRAMDNGDAEPVTFDDLGIARQRVAEWRKIRDAGEEIVERAIQGALAEGRAPTKEDIKRAIEAGAKVRGTQGTGDNEWFTPADVIDTVRKVLGVIDLDPASCDRAQRTVQALQFFSQEQDGLTRSWFGNVFLNPPYAQPHIEDFADKMIAEIDSCRVKQAIMLTHNYSDTAWFQKLVRKADIVCLPKGRIRFVAPDGTLASPTQGQAFFYFGTGRARFVEVFLARGAVGAFIGRD
jgi:phage N-6-adenine-methyltransferase